MANSGRAGHAQEPTVLSLTGTIVEGASPSPSDAYFSGFETRPTTTDPPAMPQYHEKPMPQRRDNTLDPRNVPPVIPPNHSSRTLIVCFDGTGDQFDSDNSNIVQLVSLLKKDDSTKQLVYYQTGIGTYTSPKVVSPFMSSMTKTLDTMFALNLNAHVMSGYEFLMQNYITGDKICIFGFSRGAYTARSLAGMLHKVGLLPAGNFQQVPFAYQMYTRADNIGWEQSTEFKQAFCVDVSIEFLGVWDTVDSVGIIPKRLPFTTSNTIVRTFRHAVSLDERRAKFKANLWNRPDEEELKLGTSRAATSPAISPTVSPLKRPTTDDEQPLMNNIGKKGKPSKKVIPRKEDEDDRVLSTLERIYSEKHEKTTDVDEVWFAVHVGGGSVSNKTRHSLARIPLRWMIRECFKTNTGIMFNSAALFDIGLDPSTLYPYVVPRPPPLPVASHRIQSPPANPIPIRPTAHLMKKKKSHPEIKALLGRARTPFLGTEEEELNDIMSPKYDQLKIKKAWWALEILPLTLRYQRGDNQWVTHFGSNLARPRFIPKQKDGFKVHRSVKMRMEAEMADERKRQKRKKYSPKPIFRHDPHWVD
ncbi:hypothetical protein GALMADRAFT_221114 [Galerina marginata CBS 339.88]|uniref:T6SS Phospholipase effector Tle1-like catalytic domain-containing protein n=1 Tax=Galerina marginata (strain CBS 339.88) TaxID=685588 RepID=A0A067TVZ2_GALM3|nr:hypothetical protein GALMADRAFT_221114 [Galerina marginata CBS 339.88]